MQGRATAGQARFQAEPSALHHCSLVLPEFAIAARFPSWHSSEGGFMHLILMRSSLAVFFSLNLLRDLSSGAIT